MLRNLTLALPIAAFLVLPGPGAAVAQAVPGQSLPPLSERAPEIAEMIDAMGLRDVIAIMANEGVAAATNLESSMFPGDGGAAWAAEVNRIHGEGRMIGLFEDAFPVDAMSAEEARTITEFFAAEPGASIALAEIAGRRAFLDPDTEELAREAFRQAVVDEDPRIELLTDFIQSNDLVERNVSGALNSNYAFYRGLLDGGAFQVEIPEELMLAEVWGQEPELRRETIEWLYSFQLSAYAGLEDSAIEAYTALSETPSGQALNAALFRAFDTLFDQLSYELGVAAAGFIAGEDT
ncbi:hypothetical protein N8I71_03550 [Roseibacterium sp. SDUM158016]|uniref:hypothetical protein n=1 Tax=Roseicyclus sediminis TaxID=2980997 RepID=UPI0021D00890|nr:hypothetical protein [Roseibacterium sp. SDUM158016]MCU4651888.1 hypothetical protein [Roseibacterium sp. SDUM158016]